ncbi:MAG: hypothetical protein HQL15_00970 [Candidatus Omnitrophica bacterium]|nr:hypothetical protein [Candidatus Omnitrophota bacterium]
MVKCFNTICCLIQVPLSKRDYVRFGIETFIKKGYEVFVLDLTTLLTPGYVENYQILESSNFAGIVQIKDKNQFDDFFKYRKNCFVIDFIHGNPWNVFIYQTFWKYNIPYGGLRGVYFELEGVLGVAGLRACNILRCLFLLKWDKFKNYWNKKDILLFDLPSFIGRIRPPDILLIQGLKYDRNYIPKPSKSTKFVLGHTLDYDLYLEKKNDPREVKGDYAVFLDAYSPYHPDRLIIPTEPVDPDHYYKTLNAFFDWFERKFETPIVIAAHPRARYDLKPECFPKRKWYINKTINLVEGAKVVLVPATTAISFAVIYEKPIILLTSDANIAEGQGPYMNKLKQLLKKEIINIDRPEDYEKCEIEIDKKSYDNFCSSYIKVPGSPDLLIWDIMIDAIEKSALKS